MIDVKHEDEHEIILTKREYVDLLNKAFKLQCLKNSGVDNWEWYSESFDNYREEFINYLRNNDISINKEYATDYYNRFIGD